MTIMKGEQLKHGQQEKRCRSFHKNFDLNVTAQDPEHEPNLHCELIEDHYSKYIELSGTTKKHVHNHGMEIDKHEEQLLQTKNFEGCSDELSVLAQSAEILAAQSEDSVAVTHSNNKSQDQQCSQELLDGLSSVSRVSSERRALCCEVTGTRLTQIRKQARCKYLSEDQDRYEDNQCKHLQRKTIRLSQIKHQARCKSKNDLSSSQMITGSRNEQQLGRILRLSQMKHQARSKNNATVNKGTEEQICVNQHCNGYRVTRDNENHKECQCAARRLRPFKTKKLRQQITTECVRNSADTRLHASATLLKDKDLITCQQELPQTFESLQHIQNGLLFTELPNYTVQQCDPNMGWMLYMHHVQLKEYHRAVARQHRAERIEEKRALKYKQKSKNRVLANSEAQKENLPVKKLRLTQLRRQVRTGNQCSLMQRTDEN